MKLIPFLSLLLTLLLFSGCEDELMLPALDDAEPPSELSLDFQIANDNSGLVTIRPGGRGATAFTLGFGDGSDVTETIAPGESLTHVYTEGVYTVTLEAMNIAGKTTTYTEELTVGFAAPENLVVTATPAAGNPLAVDVTATADGETNFLAFFGEDPDADPVSFQEGETVTYTYGAVGTYDIRVVARSGGAASIEDTVTVTLSNPAVLPLDFEDDSKDYTFGDFGGATATVVDNPDPSGANGSDRVGKLTKQEGSEVWAGSSLPLGAPIDFSASQQISMQVWSPAAGVPVLLKLENLGDADINAEVTVNTTVANAWETLTFDFSGADVSQEYGRLVVFFDFGNAGTGADYYFDDVRVVGSVPAETLQLPLTFESDAVNYEWIGFGGASVELIDNPDASGINTSGRVGKLNKSEGSETWAGGVIELPAPIDLAGYPQLSMQVWSPQAGIPVVLKLENATTGDINIEVTATTTVANAWEELTFDFSGGDLTQAYSKVVVFFDLGTAGTGADYYFDDIRQVGYDPNPVLALPLTFESDALTYEWIGFGGATVELIDNPDAGGINTSGRVGKLNKSEGSETWAGGVIELPAPLDLAGNSQLTMKVWSPAAGIPVVLKVENAGSGDINIEVTATTTVANAWEELTFDYSGGDLTQEYSKVVVFFDFGTAGTGADYYFDDIAYAR